ncbi:MAG: hypothetical protein HZB76_04825 [Chlamydiae bacterium]|nr:hypothetical protein [Chlamydiota bacterium]
MQKDKNEFQYVSNENLNKIVLWAVQKKDFLFYGFVAIVLLGIVIYKSGGFSHGGVKNIAQVEKSFGEWEKSFDNRSFDSLKSEINKNSSFLTKYQSQIAQKLIWRKESFSSNEENLIKDSIERVETQIPFYQKFAKTTLAISNKNYGQALDEAKELKLALKISSQTPIFVTYNLLRIASLEKELNNKEGELAALEELNGYITSCQESKDEFIKESMNSFLSALEENNVELIDYIKYRTAQLQLN